MDEKFGPVGSRGFDIVERMVRGGARTRLTRKRARERDDRMEGKRGKREEKRKANEEGRRDGGCRVRLIPYRKASLDVDGPKPALYFPGAPQSPYRKSS